MPTLLTPPDAPWTTAIYDRGQPVTSDEQLAEALTALGWPLRAEPDAPELGIWMVDLPPHIPEVGLGLRCFSADGRFTLEIENS